MYLARQSRLGTKLQTFAIAIILPVISIQRINKLLPTLKTKKKMKLLLHFISFELDLFQL